MMLGKLHKVLSVGYCQSAQEKQHTCVQCGSSCTVLCHRTIRHQKSLWVTVIILPVLLSHLSRVRITDHYSCENILFYYLVFNSKQNYHVKNVALLWKIGKKQHIYYTYSHTTCG